MREYVGDIDSKGAYSIAPEVVAGCQNGGSGALRRQRGFRRSGEVLTPSGSDNLFRFGIPAHRALLPTGGDGHLARDHRAESEGEWADRLLAASHALEKVLHVLQRIVFIGTAADGGSGGRRAGCGLRPPSALWQQGDRIALVVEQRPRVSEQDVVAFAEVAVSKHGIPGEQDLFRLLHRHGHGVRHTCIYASAARGRWHRSSSRPPERSSPALHTRSRLDELCSRTRCRPSSPSKNASSCSVADRTGRTSPRLRPSATNCIDASTGMTSALVNATRRVGAVTPDRFRGDGLVQI